jgi:GH24 family phage-related lysozyme (muramidase)
VNPPSWAVLCPFMPHGNVTNKIRLLDLFKYYKQLPHQSAAISELEEALLKADPALLNRDQAWFKTWSQGGKHQDVGPAIKLIQEFEGCHLEAYLCPAGVPTIGWGNTRHIDGRPVKLGDKVTGIEADMMLRREIDRIIEKLRVIPHWNEMSAGQQSALISFGYNLGASFYGAVGFETITKRLREKDWAKVPDALLLYCNPGSSFEAGLKRRREAEGRLWLQGMGLPEVQQQGFGNPLQVPFYAQLDSSTDQGRRMCFSSSCAMLLEYLKPGTLKGANGDDQYLKRVQQYGDTTDANAQIRALSSYGIKARFVQNASFTTLEQQIAKGIPIPCGYLHRGPISKPSGGGHYCCIIGHTPTHVIAHDPFGEADLVNGTTLNKSGRSVQYSRKNWGRRWQVEGTATGWAILAER